MKTYYLEFDLEGNAIFINEDDKNDILQTTELLRFNTLFTGQQRDYKDVEGFFEGCNCFRSSGYCMEFYRLSECGEQVTDF